VEKIEKAVLNVEGMSCGHCQAAVEQAVKQLPGIISVLADFRHKKVEVEFETSKVNLAEIKNAIEDEGYDVIGE